MANFRGPRNLACTEKSKCQLNILDVARGRLRPAKDLRPTSINLYYYLCGLSTSCLREWFREIHTKPASAYAEFASKVIQPGDVVITFNYDDSLERELSRAGVWDVSRGYGFPLGAEDTHSKTLLLKLHGSMNWLISVFGGARAGAFQVGGWPPSAFGDAPVIHPADLHHLGYADFKGRVFTGGVLWHA